jgi:hypothetical protein
MQKFIAYQYENFFMGYVPVIFMVAQLLIDHSVGQLIDQSVRKFDH